MVQYYKNKFGIFFLIFVLADLTISSSLNLEYLRVVSKPLILLSLIVYVLLNKEHPDKKLKTHLLLALTFSLVGDLALLFEEINAIYFILGLAAFLIAHIFYVLLFLKQRTKKTSISYYWQSFLFCVYGIGFLIFIKNHLGDLLYPVIAYLITILAMALTALLRKSTVPKNSFLLVFAGAIFFIISDSLLATNKFVYTLPFSNILVMSTYASAQYLIVKGILQYNDTRN